MREILFRGIRCDNGEWVEGLPIRTYDTEIGKNSVDYANPVPIVLMASSRIVLECGCNDVPFFNIDEHPIVNPETVGQYTGLKDKNGTKIFEGDVVKYIEIDIVGLDIKGKGGIRWNDNTASFEIFNGLFGVNFCQALFSQIEVIGNIHDNPELMGGNTHG